MDYLVATDSAMDVFLVPCCTASFAGINWTHTENCTPTPREAAGWSTLVAKGPPGVFLSSTVLVLEVMKALRRAGFDAAFDIPPEAGSS